MLINAYTVVMKPGDDGKVALVPYKPAHVPVYHKWMTSELLRELTASEPLSLEEEYAMCESWQKDDDKLTFIVVELAGYQADKDDVRHMVGDVNCFFNDPDDPLDNVEVEVMIAEPTARRKGFASEALELIMSYCVRELGVKGFRAQILRKNEGSKRLFERLGFRFAKAIDVFEEEVWAPSRASVHLAGRVYASGDSKNVEPSDQRQKWDVGRFVKTLFFFTDPFRGLKKMFSGAEDGSRSSAAVSGDSWVLVVGATGGVGRRVVLELLKKGRKVRALVRDMDKAQKMYAGELAGNVMNFQLVPVDITQPRTLLPEYFAGVKQLVWCAATKIVPKEGDDVDRSKYYQGIKFYDPEVSGDTPEAVELRGMENVLAAIKAHGAIPLAGGLDVFHPSAGAGLAFGPIDDVVMGGVSQSTMSISPLGGEGGTSAGIFAGNVTQANNGGFASVRSKNFSPSMDVSGYDGFELRIKGDGQRYKFIARTEDSFDGVGYTCSFDTVPGAWQTIQIPFSGLIPVFRAKTITDGSKKPFIDVSDHLSSVQLMLSKFEYDGQLNPNWSEGAFELPIQYIKAYIKDPSLPCAVMVSSAGVTRWNRPGVDVEQEPPAVKMNEMLGGLLTYKLASEDALRDSGIGACIVRPCALTEEPNGMPVEFGQGDLLKGKISRDDVAELCVALLETPGMANVCFEIKSTVPFSKPWTAEDSEQSGDKGRSWPRVAQAAGLEAGVTGKTIDGVYTGGATGK